MSTANTWKEVLFEGGTEGLTWEKLLAQYWLLYLGSAEQLKKIRCYLRLTDDDVYFFKGLRPYHIERFGGNLFIEKINKYIDSSEPIEVTAFKLGDYLDKDKIKALT